MNPVEQAAERLLEAANDLANDRFYVEARVGSENHRGKCCRVVYRGNRRNEAAEDLLRDFARAYLRDHHPDDDLPITEDWLRSVGWKDWEEDDDDEAHPDLFIRMADEIGWECRLAWQSNGFYAVRMADREDYAGRSESVELLGTRNMKPTVTRGAVRRLCSALGIQLQEPTQ